MKTLEHWFQPDKTFDISRRYFYLEWNYGTHRPKLIEWRKHKPNNCNLSKKIILNGGLPIIICGKLYNEKCEKPFQDLDTDFEYKNKSLLKSHLQKCVRLQLDCKAVRTAYFLMKRDINDFLRRLPIIMMEDTGLHSSISVVIWFMCCIDIIHIQNYMIWYFMGIVRYMAASNHFDGIDTKNYQPQKIDIIKLWNLIETQVLDIDKKNLLYSLLIRLNYGGMKGDHIMIQNMIDIILWQWGDSIPNRIINDKIRPVRIHKSLYINEFEISALDFHCYPTIIDDIQQLYPNYTKEVLKKSIWNHSSNINKRKPMILDYLEIWKTIKLEYHKLAKELLLQYY